MSSIFGSLMSNIISAGNAADSAQKVFSLKNIITSYKQYRTETHKDLSTVKRALGLDLADSYAYVSDPIHSLMDYIPPDNAYAISALADPQLSKFTIEEIDNPIRISPENNMYLIGSPSSEKTTRYLFDYAEEDEKNNYGYLKYNGNIADFPISWALDSKSASSLVSRLYEDRISFRPNWGLKIPSRKLPLYPRKMPCNGLLITDYLVVTRIPNILTKCALDHENTIVSIAGNHGIGTRAIVSLLHDKIFIKKIAEALDKKSSTDNLSFNTLLSNHDFFGLQMAFEVKATYNSQNTRYKKIEVINIIQEPILFGIGYEYWANAEKRYRKKYNKHMCPQIL